MRINVIPYIVSSSVFPSSAENYTITSIDINNVRVQLNTNVIADVRFNNYDTCNMYDMFASTTDQYNAWANDDNYLINLILTNYGLTQQS